VLLTASNGVREMSGRRVPPDSGCFFYEGLQLQRLDAFGSSVALGLNCT
jgi:hypothetical protein